jgi:hypothetical protein
MVNSTEKCTFIGSQLPAVYRFRLQVEPMRSKRGDPDAFAQVRAIEPTERIPIAAAEDVTGKADRAGGRAAILEPDVQEEQACGQRLADFAERDANLHAP